ncbi:MAG: rRNA maturation RNase YbeY [Balneolales bacterium]
MQRTAGITIINETDLPVPLTRNRAAEAASLIGEKENCVFSFVEVVYVDEPGIIEINKKHLNHDYVTDIITFGYNEPGEAGPIEATLFCCAHRIFEQAEELQVDVNSEFLRVFVHGLLHLAGYGDYQAVQKASMREKESFYLNYIKESNAK